MSYYATVNRPLLARIPVNAARVLELGCGEGALAAAYRRLNPGVHYVAIEIHGPSAAVARTRVDRLIEADFETLSDTDVTCGEPFDAIVMGDVLEHFRDPDAVLRRLQPMLAAGGQIIASVPNISHWQTFYHLFNGDWPVDNDGIFDRTHLRFFTLDSLSRACRQAGLTVGKVSTTRVRMRSLPEDTWLPRLADFAESMGIQREAFLRRSEAYQYVVTARRSDSVDTVPLFLSVAALAPTLMNVRTKLPADALASMPMTIVNYYERQIGVPRGVGDGAKILVVQRPAPESLEQWAAWITPAIRAGWLVVVEIDDHPDLIRRVAVRPDRDWSSALIGAHGLQTTTQNLAGYLRTINPEVAAFGNAAFELPEYRPNSGEVVRVFYGAVNREGYSGAVSRALAPTIAAYSDLEFSVVHDRAFFEALPTENKAFLPTLPYDAYLAEMARCDIALMPLEGAPAELFKSDVKYVEAASRSLAVIASPGVYGQTIRDGETGLIADGPDAFAAALTRLLEAPDLRRRIARAAWEDVRDHRMFAHQAQARVDWYRSLWERREALTAALRARVPAIDAALRG